MVLISDGNENIPYGIYAKAPAFLVVRPMEGRFV
jgi:hypothetical protein